MNNNKQHIRHSMLYEFQRKNNATEATKNLQEVFGKEAIKERTVQFWFQKFKKGDLTLEDASRSGRPSDVDDAILQSELKADPFSTTRELADRLQVSQTSITNHIRQLGYIQKWSKWVPHELTEKNKMNRISACSSLLLRYENEPFLDRLITGDEKWIRYNNIRRKRAYSFPGEPVPTTSKPDIHQQKVMLSLWWNRKGPIHFEVLSPNQTITADLYCDQLMRLAAQIRIKCPILANRKGVLLQHDNAKPHTAIKTQQKIHELGWEVLIHPPYSPDIAPTDYYLFRSLQNYLDQKSFRDSSDIKSAVVTFFDSKPEDFFAKGIDRLPERWRQVIANDGHYLLN